jgi:hypothetical protein
MNKYILKKLVATLLTIALGCLCLAASYKTYKENKQSLSDLTHFTGILSNFYLNNKSSLVGGKVWINRKSVALEINGLNQKIRFYRPNQNYIDFFQEVRNGDSISIYFRKHSPDYYNTDLYQIEIKGKNYLQIDKVKHNHTIAGTVIFIVGILICCMSIFVWKKTGE